MITFYRPNLYVSRDEKDRRTSSTYVRESSTSSTIRILRPRSGLLPRVEKSSHCVLTCPNFELLSVANVFSNTYYFLPELLLLSSSFLPCCLSQFFIQRESNRLYRYILARLALKKCAQNPSRNVASSSCIGDQASRFVEVGMSRPIATIKSGLKLAKISAAESAQD